MAMPLFYSFRVQVNIPTSEGSTGLHLPNSKLLGSFELKPSQKQIFHLISFSLGTWIRVSFIKGIKDTNSNDSLDRSHKNTTKPTLQLLHFAATLVNAAFENP